MKYIYKYNNYNDYFYDFQSWFAFLILDIFFRCKHMRTNTNLNDTWFMQAFDHWSNNASLVVYVFMKNMSKIMK